MSIMRSIWAISQKTFRAEASLPRNVVKYWYVDEAPVAGAVK
ncbi:MULTISPECIES: hypothetical protein [Bradyrhizobium]|nr:MULTISPECIES: hypothetical protein [Bradyrhizobium]MDF0580117.1 hypothetical protein [Bradyrhizobium yuanmingense]